MVSKRLEKTWIWRNKNNQIDLSNNVEFSKTPQFAVLDNFHQNFGLSNFTGFVVLENHESFIYTLV